MSVPFELVGAPLELPYGCVCGRGRAPFVRTRIPAPTVGDVFVCADCARRIVELYEHVPAADYAALREQLATVRAEAAESAAALEQARTHAVGLEAQAQRANEELETLRAERVAVNAEMQRLASEARDARNGQHATAIREAVADIRAAASGKQTTKTKGRATT